MHHTDKYRIIYIVFFENGPYNMSVSYITAIYPNLNRRKKCSNNLNEMYSYIKRENYNPTMTNNLYVKYVGIS